MEVHNHAHPWRTWSRRLHQRRGQGSIGRWRKGQEKEGYDQIQKDHWWLHKGSFDSSSIIKEYSKRNAPCSDKSVWRKEHQRKNEIKKTTQVSEDSKGRNYAVILHKRVWDQRKIGGRSCDDHLEWSPKGLGIFHRRYMCYKKAHQLRHTFGRMCARRRKNRQ